MILATGGSTSGKPGVWLLEQDAERIPMLIREMNRILLKIGFIVLFGFVYRGF
jgi:hypothetical protein